MIFIGLSVSNAGLKQLTLKKRPILNSVRSLRGCPTLDGDHCLLGTSSKLDEAGFIIQSAMPVMTNAPVVAKLYGADSDYAAIMVTETTLQTMVVIPILMLLMA